MRGRRPKPTALKIIEGNPGKRPLPENEPTPTGKAARPQWLRPSAAAVWDEYAPIVEEMGLLTNADAEVFGQWCSLAAMFRKAPGKMAANQVARMDAISQRFGMDPSSRSRMGTKAPSKKSNAFAALEA